MKKVVRMLGLCALVALAFTSCKKNDNTNKVTFKATITQPTSDGRTHINDNNMLAWDANDKIFVFNTAGEYQDFTVSSIGDADAYQDYGAVFEIPESKAEFMAGIETSGLYTAYYPNASIDGSNVILQVPATQNYVAMGSIATNTYPMFATNDSNNFPFLSDAGVLRIKLYKNNTYANDIYVTKLVLRATGDGLAGNMIYPYANPANYQPAAVLSDEITLNCVTEETPNGVALYGPGYEAIFNFVVLKDALQGAFSVDVYTNGTEPFETLTAGTTLDHSIEAMRITEMGSKPVPAPSN